MLHLQYLTRTTRLVPLAKIIFLICFLSISAIAQEAVLRTSFVTSDKDPIPVNVLTGQSCLIIFDQPIGRLAVSNTETAEAVVVAPNQLMINGKSSGRSRFTTWAKDGERFIFFDVDVRSNLAQIDSQVRALFPKEDIRLSQANGSVVISGNVDSKIAGQIETVVQAAGFKTVNLLTQPIQGVMQVQLQLRVAEVSRNKLSELAISPAIQRDPGQGGYFNTGQGPFSVSSVESGSILGAVAPNLNLFVMSNGVFTFLRALQQQGALRQLAEPNLVAMNGQQASFLAGGELPIPVFQGGGGGGSAVTIQYKEYGIRVNFKPNILDEQHIRLEIESEVSTLDYNNAVRFSGFLIPALRTRRAKTTIELQDGQSFGIAGLLDNNETRSLAKLPVISSVPTLGNLFKSKSFQKSESELVFITTAKITEPLNPDAFPNMKGIDGLKGSSPLGVESPAPQTNTGDKGGAAGAATTSINNLPAKASIESIVAPASSSPLTPEGTDGVGSKKTSLVPSPSSMNTNEEKVKPVPATPGDSGDSGGKSEAKEKTKISAEKTDAKHPAEKLNWKLLRAEVPSSGEHRAKAKK